MPRSLDNSELPCLLYVVLVELGICICVGALTQHVRYTTDIGYHQLALISKGMRINSVPNQCSITAVEIYAGYASVRAID